MVAAQLGATTTSSSVNAEMLRSH